MLGPLAVRVDGVDVAPTAGKPRALLVRLLVAGGRPVAAERLIEDLWEGDPPRSGAQTLQTYVLQLRKSVGIERLVTDGGGYRLVVHDGELDAAMFEADVSAGRQALTRRATSEAIDALQRALRLWRGRPLADAGGAAWAQGEAARLEELRLVAHELLLEAQLLVGQDAEVVAAAESAVAEHPLRERLWAHLITALYRQGRQADALRAFQRLRRHLADELGIDPSPELRELEQAVLDQDPRLAVVPPAREPVAPMAATVTLPSGLVTFLLTDVVGSTRLWDTVARLMPDALALHDETIRAAVESHGGVVLKARGEGDSVFAVFRRATDAANAAVAAQQALASVDWDDGCSLSVRMAVHSGEALERDGDYYGPTVNRAARLRALASGGQIIVSHTTADVIVDHLGPEVRLVELGPQQLRDLERPETVYLLVDADSTTEPDPERLAASPIESPALPSALATSGAFVGREHELERLVAEWERVEHGPPRVVMLGGEPGVGKTRLAAEFARRVHGAGGVVLYGRCDEELGAPYQPFAEALRLLLPSLDANVLRAVRGVEELTRLVPEVADVVPDLRTPTHSDPDTERYALFDTVARLFVSVSKDKPILVVLDDLHWAAKPTLLMLRHVLRFGEGARVQLLGTYRTTDLDPNHPLSGALADLHRDGAIERLVLAGLDEDDVGALLEATGHDDDELARALSTVTSGNPFFLIEVLRHVEETGGGWDPNTLPQGVREAVGRRLTRLTDETRDALLAGAVAGAQFSLELVEEVLGRDLLDEVGEACDAGILVEESQGKFRFNHALVRQSLLTGVASVKRVRLHQRIAQTLEMAEAETDENLADLAYHYFESAWAGNAAKAVEYCRRAADQAMARLAYEGAAGLYERAVHALDVEEVSVDDGARAELLLARCEAHLAAGDAAGAAAAVTDLERAAGDSRALGAWVVCFQAQLAVLTRPEQLDEMERRVASAAEEFAALKDAAGEAVAHNTRASCLARLGRFAECELALDRALTAARQPADSSAADHRRVNAVLAGAPSAALWGPNPVARAGGRCLDVIRLLRITTGSPAVEATSVRCQAILEAFRGREQAARRMLESTRRTLAELGLRHALLEVDLYEGMVDLLADDAQAAAAHLRRAYDGLSRLGLDADAAEAAALLARAYLALGDEDGAEHLCVESERLGGQDLRASIAWRTVRAELLARWGQHQRAREVAEAAIALAEPTDALVDQGDAYLALAVVLGAAGDHHAAVDAANLAVGRYERKGASALAARARRFAGTATTASAGAEHGEEAPAWLPAGAFVAHLRRYNEIFAARAWPALGDVVHPDVAFESRRHLTLQPSSSGIAAYTDFLTSVAEHMGYGAVRNRYVAARGRRLVLARSTVVGHDDAPEAATEELWNVLELSEDDRLAATVVFDVEDLDAAYAELDARYLAGAGAEHAGVFRAIAEALDAYNRRDPASAPMDATAELIDHRPASVVADSGSGLWSDFEGAIAQVPDSTLRLAAVHELEGDGAVVTTVHRGSTTDGVIVERVFHSVHLVDRGRITRVELYPENELDAALARFRELQRDVTLSSVPENVASTLISHIYRAAERHDWAALGALVADGFGSADRRWGTTTRGRDALLEGIRVSFDMGEQRLESTTLATRGEHLALTCLRVRGRGESDGTPELEVLLVVAADRGGRLAEAVVFEPDEIDAAVRELNARYLAGEGAPYEATLAPVLESTELRLRDWDRWVELLVPDVEFVDHRSAAHGVVKGRDAVAEALAPNPGERNMNVAVEMVDHGVVLMRVSATGTSADGLEAEWPLYAVWRVVGGFVIRLDVFEPEDFAAARATFDEIRRLSPASLPWQNAAARAHRESFACMLEQRWADLEERAAEDILVEDRRAIVQHTTRGRRDFIESARAGVKAGFRQGDTEIVATRGDRLVLSRTTSASGDGERGAAESVFLSVTELDAAGRVSAAIGFDVDDLDSAFDELNTRYLAGEGAPYADTLGPVLEAVEVRVGDGDRFAELLSDDVAFVDHRPAALGVIEGRDAIVQTLNQGWTVRNHTVAVAAVDHGVVLTLERPAGHSADGVEVEWLLLVLFVVEDRRLKRFHVYEADAAADALAMFEQLRRPAEAAAIADNAATTALAKYHSACERRDWAAAELLLAADVVGDERRSGAHIRWEGPAAHVEAVRSAVDVWLQRFESTTVATRGSRLALVEVQGHGNDAQAGAPELGVLDVVEVDAHGRITATVLFDDDDTDAAFDELNARYLAGGGEPYAATLGPVLEAVEVRVRDWGRWAELLADDVTFVDHRLAALGVIEGREALVRTLNPEWNERGHTVAVQAVDHGVVLTLDRAAGLSADGLEAEWLILVLWVVENGRLERFDVFEAGELAEALAMFEQLRRPAQPPPVADNAAATALSRYHSACERRDWAAAEVLLAEDAVSDERHSGAHIRWEGAAAHVEAARSAVDVWVQRFESTTMATRGSRLALVEVRGIGNDPQPGAPELAVLDVVEVDAQGRITATVAFDDDETDAAFAELNARYLAGEGAAFASTVASFLEYLDARISEPERSVEVLADDVIFVDHRPASLGVIEGREAFVAALQREVATRHDVLTIDAIDDGVALVLLRTMGFSGEGGPVEWQSRVLCATRNGLLARAELFELTDVTSAERAFEELRRTAESSRIEDNVAADVYRRYLAAWFGRDGTTAEMLLATDVVSDDRRSGSQLRLEGLAAVVESDHAVAELGVARFEQTTVATRGSRLALLRVRVGGRAHGSGAPEVELLVVTESDTAGQIAAIVAFDIEDADAAFAELDRRYLAGEGAPHASTIGPVLECVQARYMDHDRFTALLRDDLEVVDHRPAAFGVIQGRDAFLDVLTYWGTVTRVLVVEQVDHGAVLLLFNARVTTDEGADAEWLLRLVGQVADGLIVRWEIFDHDQGSDALAAFEQLRKPADASPVAENVAASAFARHRAAYAERDWAAVEALFAEDAVADDRRPGAQLRLQGREALIESMRSTAAVGFVRFEWSTMATRGDRLALVVVRSGGVDQDPGSPGLEVLDVVEVDSEGRIAAVVTFDVDDIDAASDELNLRYLAGEGAPYGSTLGLVLERFDVVAREPDRLAEFVAPDVVLVDHRLAGFGAVEGRPALTDLLREPHGRRYRFVAVERVDHGVVLSLVRVVGETSDGGPIEWLLHDLLVVEGGVLSRLEIFDVDDLDHAHRRFEELRPAPSRSPAVENLAAASAERLWEACTRFDWEVARALYAEDVASDDMRSGIRLAHTGRESILASWRFGAAAGGTRYVTTPIATRGERLVLSRLWCGAVSAPGAPVVELLHIVETEADGLIISQVALDLDDMDTAFAELDRRYLAGEGAPHAGTIAVALEGNEAAARDLDRWAELHAESITVVDHRPAAFGIVEGRDAFQEFLGARWAKRIRTIAIERLDVGVALVLCNAIGESDHGSPVEWVFYELSVVENGVVTRSEIFDVGDLDDAVARFEELRPSAASAITENLAAATVSAFVAAFLRGDWDAAGQLMAEDVIGPDHRIGIGWGTSGRDETMTGFRFGMEHGVTRFDATTIATRGDRLVLSMTSIGAGRASETVVEMLLVVETDTAGQITAIVAFDVEDVDAAFAELDRRYLAGEGAPFGSTIGPVIECNRGKNSDHDRFVALMREDLVVVDHRPAAFGVIHGRDAFLDALDHWGTSAQVLVVEQVDQGTVLVLVKARATTDESVEVEWLFHLLVGVDHGLVERWEIFDSDQHAAALEAFERRRRPADVSSIPDNSAARAIGSFLDACVRGDWARAQEIGADNLVMDDLRSGVQLRGVGRDGWIATHRFGVDLGVTRFETTVIATRGDRLVLSHLWCGTEARGGAPVVEMLQVVETDEGGRIIRTVGFDADDFDSAFAELDRRYLAGQGAPYAATVGLLLDLCDSVVRDRDRWETLLAEKIVLVDRRPAGFGVFEGRSAVTDLMRPAQWAQSARLVAVERVEHGSVLALVRIVGESDSGGGVEWLMRNLMVFDGALATRVELLEVDDLEAAHARFDELRPHPSPISENLAAATVSAFVAAFLRDDWDAAEQFVAEEVTSADHRPGLRSGGQGRLAFVEGFRFGIEQGASRYEATTVATRGERLVLCRLWCGTHEAGAPEVELLMVIATDAAVQITASVAFDIDDLDGAFAELDRRYLAGEGAPSTDAVATLFAVLDAARDRGRSWEGVVDLLVDDVAFVDHRPASLGGITGRPAFVDALRPLATDRLRVTAIERACADTALAQLSASAAEDVAAEWRLYVLCQVAAGRVQRYEFFADDDLDAALARFEELARSTPPNDNAAARAHRREYAAVLDGRWDELEDLVAEDVLLEDRRSVIRISTHGRAGFIENCQLSIAVGFRRGATEVVATRGDRLVLSRVTAATGDTEEGGPENVSLFLTEIDEPGRVIAAIGFDVDDADSAFAELDARYAAGEAAPFEQTWLAVVEVYRRFNEGRGELRWPAAPVEVTAFADIPGVRARITAVHRLGDRVAFLTVSASAPDVEAREWLVALTVGDGRISSVETYATDDFEAALTRFEELASGG